MRRIVLVVGLVIAACGVQTEPPQKPWHPWTDGPPSTRKWELTPDGRIVVYGNAPMWCFLDDLQMGMCHFSPTECERREALYREQEPTVKVEQCRQLWATACDVTTRAVTGQLSDACYPSVSQCDRMSANAIRRGDSTGDPRCAVYRMRNH